MALVAAALPAAVVLVDSLTWMNDGVFANGRSRAWFFFTWLAVKTAILSWSAGRFLGATRYGWLVFFWCQMLLDVHTTLASYGLGGHDLDGLAHTLISAQIGFLALWAILSKTGLGWRLTCIFLAATGILAQVISLNASWNTEAIPVVQAVAAAMLVAVCVALRVLGFQLQAAAPLGNESSPAQRDVMQFGTKHMLLWAAALSPLMLAVKRLDLASYQQLGIADVDPAATLSAWTALVVLATIWLALGQKAAVARMIIFAAAIAGAGIGMYWQSLDWRLKFGQWPQQQMIRLTIEMGPLWIAWFALIGGLLAAMLLFLRASGFRLTRAAQRQRRESLRE